MDKGLESGLRSYFLHGLEDLCDLVNLVAANELLLIVCLLLQGWLRVFLVRLDGLSEVLASLPGDVVAREHLLAKLIARLLERQLELLKKDLVSLVARL